MHQYVGLIMEIKNLFTNDTKILDLTNYRINTYNMPIDSRIRRDVMECWDSWYSKDNKLYFFKNFYDVHEQDCTYRFINELIGVKLAEYLKLDSIKYNIAKADKEYGLASLNFHNRDNNYYFVRDLYLPLNSFNMKNLDRIRTRCRDNNNHQELVKEILKAVAIDIYMNQKDRTYSNIQFRKDKNGLHYAPAYDFEESFINPRETTYESGLLRIDTNSRRAYENYPLLKIYLERLFDVRITDTLEEIEDDYSINIPNKAKNYYRRFINERERVIMK